MGVDPGQRTRFAASTAEELYSLVRGEVVEYDAIRPRLPEKDRASVWALLETGHRAPPGQNTVETPWGHRRL